jgi:hypothetical protein
LLAFKTADRSMLLWNVLDAPQTSSYDQAVEVLNDLLAMPGHEEMTAHYQYSDKMGLLNQKIGSSQTPA